MKTVVSQYVLNVILTFWVYNYISGCTEYRNVILMMVTRKLICLSSRKRWIIFLNSLALWIIAHMISTTCMEWQYRKLFVLKTQLTVMQLFEITFYLIFSHNYSVPIRSGMYLKSSEKNTALVLFKSFTWHRIKKKILAIENKTKWKFLSVVGTLNWVYPGNILK